MVEKCFGSIQPIRQNEDDELPSELIEDIPELYEDYEHYSDVLLTLDEKRRIRNLLDGWENIEDAAKENFYNRMGVYIIEAKLKRNIANCFGESFVESRAKQRPFLKIGNNTALQPSGQKELLQPNLVNGRLKRAAQPEETNIYEHEQHYTEEKEVSASVPTEKCAFVSEDTDDAFNKKTPGTTAVKLRDVVEYDRGNLSDEKEKKMVEKCFGSIQPIRQNEDDELPSELIEDIPELYEDYEHYSDVLLTLDEKRRIRNLLDGWENIEDAAKENFYNRMGVYIIEAKLKRNIANCFGESFVESRAKQRPFLKIGNSTALQPSGQKELLQPNLVNGRLKRAAQPEETNIYEHEQHYTEEKEVSASVPTEKCAFVSEDTDDAFNKKTPGTTAVKLRDVVEYDRGNLSDEKGIINIKEQEFENNLVASPSSNRFEQPVSTFMQQIITPSTSSTVSNAIRQPSAPDKTIRFHKRERAHSNTDAPPCKRTTLQALEKKLRPGHQPHESCLEQNIR